MADSRENDPDRNTSAGTDSRPPVDGVVDVFIEQEDEGGSIRISEDVIVSVVRRYTLAVPGVAGFASDTFVDGLADMFRRRSHGGAIAVSDMHGETVSIGVTLVLEFGVVIPEVAGHVQQAIRAAMAELTGKQVASVDVTVAELKEAAAEGEGEPAE